MFFYVFFMQPIHVIIEENKEHTELLETSEDMEEELKEIYKYDLFYEVEAVNIFTNSYSRKIEKSLKSRFKHLFLEIFIPPPEL